VIGFHIPSFLIEHGNPVTLQGCIAGDQKQDARATILVCEGLFDEQKWKRGFFHIHRDGHQSFEVQRVDSLVTSSPCTTASYGVACSIVKVQYIFVSIFRANPRSLAGGFDAPTKSSDREGGFCPRDQM
jgi:hypothetical protein